ncbi:conserved unknown protein [Ectocarpus siliculosus]|uniref:FHA domain-containing protein n=1 Tax=Ectocarpus siliculosus TaxID=2880 RepID=D7FHX7_ECTSI|nr:conserved unknown protein [Ectocarpus siliculosus]|eukprot:CBJ48988.1 conserved unknown protein [Ectocarpus siliculosus]
MATATSKDDEPCAFAKLWGQLDGAPFHTYVTQLPSTLGRGSQATEGARKSAGFIDLGRSKALSREHAVITWVPSQKSYQIKCMSKNGMVVAGSYHAKGGVEKLESRAPIKLGPASMYFLLPEREAQKPAPAPATAVAAPRVTPPPAASAPQAKPLESRPAPPSSQGLPPENSAPAAVVAPSATTVAAAAPAPAPVSFGDMISQAFRSRELSAVAAASGGLSSGDVQNWIMQAYPEWNKEGPRMKALAVGIEEALNESFVSRGGDRWAEDSSVKRVKLNNGTPTPAVAAAITAATAAAAATGSLASPREPAPAAASVAPVGAAQTEGRIDVSGMTG